MKKTFLVMRFTLLFLLLSQTLGAEEKPALGIFTCKIQGVGCWDPDSLSTGIAGSEEAVIYIAQQLATLGYQVIVYGNPPKNSLYSSEGCNPRYVDLDTAETIPLDIAISWRMPFLGQALKKRAKTVYLWPHDTIHCHVPDDHIRSFDDILWLSKWQRKQWISVNPTCTNYTHIFGNGIEPEQFDPITERANPYSCIYGSNYARGLEFLLELWPEIKQQYPKATLDIYYGWQHWGLLTPEQEAKMRQQIETYASLSVTDHGKVGHRELNEAYAKASIWAYPCICPETFCITALRAQASGTIPVIIEGSALSETVQGDFRCTDRNSYLATLFQAMGQAEKISVKERNEYKDWVINHFTWSKIAKKWDALFQHNLEVKKQREAVPPQAA